MARIQKKSIPKKSAEEKAELSADAIARNVGTLVNQSIVDEMQDSYLAYAMSVIVSRALPDVRDR